MTLGASPPSLTWTFLAPACPRPSGGDLARFELVNALARVAGQAVCVVHLPHDEATITSLADLPWFRFDSAVEHVFLTGLDPDRIPRAEVAVYSTKLIATVLAPSATAAGAHLLDDLERGRLGLPVQFVQGHGIFPDAAERRALGVPGLKVCVSAWLADLVARAGVPAHRIQHIPNGVDPTRFQVLRPIHARPAGVSMNFNPFPVKRGREGLEAVERVHAELGVPVTLFGTLPLLEPRSSGISFLLSPDQGTLARDVYNTSSVFLQPGRSEGFGLCAVEAMACGAALVTTQNGGSAEYAIDGETALVCGDSPAEMAEAIRRLILDDELRERIAASGARFVERFRWDRSATRLVALVDRERAGLPRGRQTAQPTDAAPGPWG